MKNKIYNQILDSQNVKFCRKINWSFACSAIFHLIVCYFVYDIIMFQKIEKNETECNLVCEFINLRISQPGKIVEVTQKKLEPLVVNIEIIVPEIIISEPNLSKIKNREKKKLKKNIKFLNIKLSKKVAKSAKKKNVNESIKTAKIANNNELIRELLDLINKNKCYPRIAKKRGIVGTVEVKIFISTHGFISKYEIISSKHSLLTKGVKETMDNILKTKLNGTKTCFIVPIKFNLI